MADLGWGDDHAGELGLGRAFGSRLCLGSTFFLVTHGAHGENTAFGFSTETNIVFSCGVQVGNLDGLLHICDIGIYSQGSNFVFVGLWSLRRRDIRQTFEVPGVNVFLSSLRCWILTSQKWHLRIKADVFLSQTGCVTCVSYAHESLCLSTCNLVGFDSWISVAWSGSPSFLEYTSSVFFICHLEWAIGWVLRNLFLIIVVKLLVK